MRHAVHALAVCVGVALVAQGLQAQTSFALASLTVPAERLVPAGCELSPAPWARIGGNRVRTGLWAGLPISSNPWSGTDPKTVVAIRERVVSSPPAPDGPPLSGAQLARFRLQLADDIEEAYAAVYADAASALVAVHAVRFKESAVPPRRATRHSGPHYVDLNRALSVTATIRVQIPSSERREGPDPRSDVRRLRCQSPTPTIPRNIGGGLRCNQCVSPPVSPSGRLKSSRRSAPAAWARSTARATSG